MWKGHVRNETNERMDSHLMQKWQNYKALHPTPMFRLLICIPAARSRFGHFATIWAMGFSERGLDYSSGRCNSSSPRQQPHSLFYERPHALVLCLQHRKKYIYNITRIAAFGEILNPKGIIAFEGSLCVCEREECIYLLLPAPICSFFRRKRVVSDDNTFEMWHFLQIKT
jgi:hypothetical protein